MVLRFIHMFFFISAALVSGMIAAASASDQDSPNPLAPMTATADYDDFGNQDVYPLYKLTPDKIKIIELPEPASSTIVGNEQHLSIFFDTTDRAALVPRMPGASHFQILNAKGQVIAAGHAIVASPENDYVRVRRNCPGDSEDCRDMSVYFCPGMCHDVLLPENGAPAPTQEAAAAEIQ